LPFSWVHRMRVPQGVAVAGCALAWLVVVSALHVYFNGDGTEGTVVRMGYMPVIANLACPLLDAASKGRADTRFEAVKFSSFAEMAEALRAGHIDAAFIIAPLSIVLRQQGAAVKVVYIGNRHESTLVIRSDLPAKDFGELAGRTLAVPLRYSGHNLCARQLQDRFGIGGAAVRIVEMNPPDMPAALATGALDAYFVGEPFGTASVRSGKGKVLYRVEELWPGFISNLMVVREDLIERAPATVQRLVSGAARSGIWARDHRIDAAAAVAPYWNQDPGFVGFAFEAQWRRIVWDRFVPVAGEMQYLADQMVRFGLLPTSSIAGLIDDRFARATKLDDITDLQSVLSGDSRPVSQGSD